ncbi:MAG: sialate O-acetylesterase [Clostridiales bacterium]|nr:sialate O-acetylesterase [Clostridiales bacterium]
MFKPAAIFRDHMILCRNKTIRVFGECDTADMITGQLGPHTARAEVQSGRFQLLFPPMDACEDLTLSLSDGQTSHTFTDVAVGEVYLAGGQSNMELALMNADEGPDCIAIHDDPLLRFYNVPRSPFWDENAIQAEENTRWDLCKPGELKDASAVAYFFARKLRQKLNVPVGIIGCNWGGTSASCWTEQSVLESNAAGRVYLDLYQQTAADKTDEAYDLEVIEYEKTSAAWNKQVDELHAAHPDMSWSDVIRQLGDCPWPPPMGRKSAYRPAGLVETMLKRVVPYTLTGFLFYQGEEDSARPEWYDMLLGNMVLNWRKLFMDEELPFLNVQLPVFKNFGEEDYTNWGTIRDQQWRVYRRLRNTGLAITIDLGELGNIHPTDKRSVGERLYEVALSTVYGQEGKTSIYATGKYPQGNTLVVTLSGQVSVTQDAGAPFEIAGADGVYQPAQAEVSGDRILLTAQGVEAPVMARYAFINYTLINLFGENGLPLAPFVLE